MATATIEATVLHWPVARRIELAEKLLESVGADWKAQVTSRVKA